MKPQPIYLPNKNYFAWPYEEQTQIKHRVLEAYSKVYISKLGANTDTLFVDCHGGCGVYIDDKKNLNYGSSIRVYQACEQVFSKRRTKNYIAISEQDKKNCDNLSKVLHDLKIKNVKVYCGDYNDVLNDEKLAAFYQSHPTLFFIDPFGYYDTPMSQMKKLMNSYGNEILINFMFDFLNRGIGVSSIDQDQLMAFFGTDEWRNAQSLSGLERESYLVNLYKKKLKETTNAQYVFAYRLCYPNKNQTYYYLIHATNHIDGISLMKSCFASINNGRVEYLGRRNNNYSLFDMDFFKQNEISNLLKNLYTGSNITFQMILEDIIEDTAVLEKDLRATLKAMEANGEISVDRVTSKTFRGLGGNDIICFHGGNN